MQEGEPALSECSDTALVQGAESCPPWPPAPHGRQCVVGGSGSKEGRCPCSCWGNLCLKPGAVVEQTSNPAIRPAPDRCVRDNGMHGTPVLRHPRACPRHEGGGGVGSGIWRREGGVTYVPLVRRPHSHHFPLPDVSGHGGIRAVNEEV